MIVRGLRVLLLLLRYSNQEKISERTLEKDGHSAQVFGYGVGKEKRISKPVKGQMKGKSFLGIREVKGGECAVSVDEFSVGDMIEIHGTSKGKGFAGVVKRHGFSGAPKTHGTKHTQRAPGSIGSGLRTRVPPGMKMAGRMGGSCVCIKGSSIVHIDTDQGVLFVKGSVPGPNGGIVEVRRV